MSNDVAPTPVFIGMPVFRGWEVIEETLRSIRDQAFQNYRVVISVDGADERTADVCRKYTNDPRYELVVQPRQLGWAANLNWLMSICDREFFCYWQQDDICATSYLEVLHAHASRNPEAACTYCDIQWFGGRIGRESLPSIVGSPLQRVLTQVEKGHFAPFRGLIRTEAIRAAGPIRLTQYDSRLEDLTWLARLAAHGELHRVDDTLYFKRVHGQNVHSSGRPLPKEFRLAVWIEYGLGMLEAALPLVRPSGAERLLHVVLERLILSREGRWLFYDPAEDRPDAIITFANDFVDAAVYRFALPQWQSIVRLPDPFAALELLAVRPPDTRECPSERMLLSATLRNSHRQKLREAASREGTLDVRFAAGEMGTCLLDRGWSSPEDWGVWSDGRSARLTLPIPAEADPWLLSIRGHAYGAGRVILRREDQVIDEFECTAASPGVAADFLVHPEEGGALTAVDIDLPDAVSPVEIGASSDARILGIGLTFVRITRQSAAV